MAAAVAGIRKGASTEEARYLVRALRGLSRVRKHLTAEVLATAISRLASAAERAALLALFGGSEVASEGAEGEPAAAVFEVDGYLHLLAVVHLLDQGDFKRAVPAAEALVQRLQAQPRHTANELLAKAYFYLGRVHELNGTDSALRATLHAALRTATLRKDYASQAALINLLLRNYISANLIAQAEMLVTKTVFPESASNAEAARYLYYLGRIRAVQLDYSEAHSHLEAATRKAAKTAVGFLQTAHKLAVIVQMLLGEIPERDLFRQPELRRSLQPYFQLTQAVRIGDLNRFQDTVKQYRDVFCRDKNYKLILRLRHNVIKTGIRMINVSYSRISLADIATKLQLDSAEDAEFLVAKAIRDGVVDASIDHDQGFVRSNEILDVYSTLDPQDNFHQRIQFCLKLHTDSVKVND